MNKVTPITYKARNASPFKLNQTLVDGASSVYGSMNQVKKAKTKASPGNNQQPAVNVSIDLTDLKSKDDGKPETDPKVKKENDIVEEYKPDDIVGFFNNIFNK